MRVQTVRSIVTGTAFAAMASGLGGSAAFANELTGFAMMPANTFAEGPTSGQFAGAGAGGNALPLLNKQPVQGISAVLAGPTDDSFYVMPDNGFGAKTNSADALLRIYALKPDFTVWTRRGLRGSGTVAPVSFRSGRELTSFSADSFISLSDPNRRLGFTLVSDMATYPNGDNTIPVDPSIRANHLLTGSDFDIESVRLDSRGHFWFGEEFGPFLVEADGTNIGDMTAINDHQFLVIERNGVTATSTSGTPFKKIFVADLTGVPSGGFAHKTELVDLMNISDPHDLNGDGQTVFTFPYVTIESVLILDPSTLLVINDNNYPGTGGRDTSSDHTEFLKIRLDQRLDVARDCHGEDDDGDHEGHDR